MGKWDCWVMVGVIAGCVTLVHAQPPLPPFLQKGRNKPAAPARKKAIVNTPHEKRMDRNHDGVVDVREAHKAKKVKGAHKTGVAAGQPVAAPAKALPAPVPRVHVRWRAVMDVDANGVVTVAERRSYWRTRRAKVNTKVEAAYDADHNGIIEGVEVRAMLKGHLATVKRHGKAAVNTPIEAAFDANKDGVIQSHEADELRSALGE